MVMHNFNGFKYADIERYLNSHPMFNHNEPGICKSDFFYYYDHKIKYITSDRERLYKMDLAIWCTGNYDDITMEDCRWFFKEVEPLWREFYNVSTSGFFEKELPEVPKGLLKLPESLG